MRPHSQKGSASHVWSEQLGECLASFKNQLGDGWVRAVFAQTCLSLKMLFHLSAQKKKVLIRTTKICDFGLKGNAV